MKLRENIHDAYCTLHHIFFLQNITTTKLFFWNSLDFISQTLSNHTKQINNGLCTFIFGQWDSLDYDHMKVGQKQ